MLGEQCARIGRITVLESCTSNSVYLEFKKARKSAIVFRQTQPHTVGGQTVANRSQRFSELPVTSGMTPGPGRYTLSKKTDWIKAPPNPAITVVPPSVSFACWQFLELIFVKKIENDFSKLRLTVKQAALLIYCNQFLKNNYRLKCASDIACSSIDIAA